MQNPAEVVGKTAIFFESGVVPHTIRVMVTKHVKGETYILSNFDKPEVTYNTSGWNFTVEKDVDQPTTPMHDHYLSVYEGLGA